MWSPNIVISFARRSFTHSFQSFSHLTYKVAVLVNSWRNTVRKEALHHTTLCLPWSFHFRFPDFYSSPKLAEKVTQNIRQWCTFRLEAYGPNNSFQLDLDACNFWKIWVLVSVWLELTWISTLILFQRWSLSIHTLCFRHQIISMQLLYWYCSLWWLFPVCSVFYQDCSPSFN